MELRTPSARGLGGPYADRSKIGSDGSLARPLPSLRIARDSAGHVRASGRSLSRLLACWTLLAALAPPSLLEEINSVFLSDYLKDASQIKGRVGCGPCSLDLPPFWPANHSYNSAACI